jgi:putative transposase
MKDLRQYRTCVCNINYHIVFSVKYRRKVLNNTIEASLKEIVLQTAIEKDFEVVAMEVGELDHVHIFVKAHPKYAIGQIVKWIKGISGRKLFIRHPDLKQKLWKGHLWTNSYYVETIGSTSEENIRKYIEGQSKEPKSNSSHD